MVCSSLPTVIVRNTPRALRICHSPGRARRASRTVRRARVTCRCREPADAALKNDGESVAREAWSGSTEPDTICVPFGLPLLRQEQYCRQATLCRLCTCRRVSRPHYQRRTSPRGCTLHATARTANIGCLMRAEFTNRGGVRPTSQSRHISTDGNGVFNGGFPMQQSLPPVCRWGTSLVCESR